MAVRQEFRRSPLLRPRLRDLVMLARPRQWVKNGLVFAALLFSGELFAGAAAVRTLLAFAAFCLASSATYALNDLLDADADRSHPVKRKRPVAAGLVSRGQAAWMSGLLAACSLGLAFLVTQALGWILLSYLIITTLYSLWIKHMVLLDIMAVATGFVLRAVGGAVAIAVPVSRWFMVCVLLLSLFLAAAKRRQEAAATEQPGRSRKVLSEYPIPLLDQMLSVLSGAAIVAYLLYTMEAIHPALFVLTGPFVIYGIFRYLYLVHQRAQGATPEEVFLSDWPLMADVAIWGIVSVLLLYIR